MELKSNTKIDSRIIEHFEFYRNQVNVFLDSDYKMLKLNEKHLKRIEIFDTFIYGNLSHAKSPKKYLFDEWRSDQIIFPFIENSFVETLSVFLDAIFYIYDLNILVIEQPNS